MFKKAVTEDQSDIHAICLYRNLLLCYSTIALNRTATAREAGNTKDNWLAKLATRSTPLKIVSGNINEVFGQIEKDVLSATARIKCGFCAPPLHDFADALRRSRSRRTGDEGTRSLDHSDGGGDAYDESAS